MPTIHVEMFAGRSDQQKEKMAERFTQVLVEEGGARPETVHVIFVDVAPSNWAVGGKLAGRKQD